jgi:hypothetical protein
MMHPSSLGLLVVQNASIVLLIRHSRISRTDETPLYASSVAVCLTEAIKLVFSYVMVLWELRVADKGRQRSWAALVRLSLEDCFGSATELTRMAVPGGLYALLNNLGCAHSHGF